MGQYTSSNEKVLEKLNGLHLTEDRVIKVTKSRGNTNYKDVQLDKIVGFQYKRRLSYGLLAAAGISGIAGVISLSNSSNEAISSTLIFGSLALIAAAFLKMSKNYVIKTENEDVNISIDKSEDVFQFWQKVNDQKNK